MSSQNDANLLENHYALSDASRDISDVVSLTSSSASIPSSGVSVPSRDDVRAPHRSGASQNSSVSDGEFVRFGQDELAEIPAEILAEYGNQMAHEVLRQITDNNVHTYNGIRPSQQHHDNDDFYDNDLLEAEQGQSQSASDENITTPATDELVSPISNYMEQDLYAQPGASDLIQGHEFTDDHSAQKDHQDQQLHYAGSEFDPLAGRIFDHNFDQFSSLNQFAKKEESPKQTDHTFSYNTGLFGETDRPEVVPVGELDSLKESYMDSDSDLIVEPVPNSYEKPTETQQVTMENAENFSQTPEKAQGTGEHGDREVSEQLQSQPPHMKEHHEHHPQYEDLDNEYKNDYSHYTEDENAQDYPKEFKSSKDKEYLERRGEVRELENAEAENRLAQLHEEDAGDHEVQDKMKPAEVEKDDESDHDDTLASLPSESKGQNKEVQTPLDEDGNRIPESSSITGMRDFTVDGADDEEAMIQARAGRPLLIPSEAMLAAGAATLATGAAALTAAGVIANQPKSENTNSEQMVKEEHDVEDTAAKNTREDDLPIPSNWPIRPPTPPKSLENSEDEEEKPSTMNLGPPPPSHFLAHRTSVSGLHSILKRHEDKAWIHGFTDPTILDLVYWRNPKRSCIALAVSLVVLYLFSQCTILSVFAYTALAVLAAAIGFRIFKIVEARFKNTDGTNPFKPYLEQEVVVPQEKLHAQVEVFLEHAQCAFKQLRHLFLVENIVDSFKFGLLLYTLTYIGSWFSGLTLIFIFIVTLFSVPKVYELNKEPIDHYLAIAQEHLEKIQHTIEDKLPFLKKQVETEKKEH